MLTYADVCRDEQKRHTQLCEIAGDAGVSFDLYWYKSTNTDAKAAAAGTSKNGTHS
jgi:hypothetical protein